MPNNVESAGRVSPEPVHVLETDCRRRAPTLHDLREIVRSKRLMNAMTSVVVCESPRRKEVRLRMAFTVVEVALRNAASTEATSALPADGSNAMLTLNNTNSPSSFDGRTEEATDTEMPGLSVLVCEGSGLEERTAVPFFVWNALLVPERDGDRLGDAVPVIDTSEPSVDLIVSVALLVRVWLLDLLADSLGETDPDPDIDGETPFVDDTVVDALLDAETDPDIDTDGVTDDV